MVEVKWGWRMELAEAGSIGRGKIHLVNAKKLGEQKGGGDAQVKGFRVRGWEDRVHA